MSSLEAILELKEKLNTLDVEISDKITIGDFPNTGRGVKANEVWSSKSKNKSYIENLI